jgi:hypothetical protein
LVALRVDKKWILSKTQYGEMNRVGCCESRDLKKTELLDMLNDHWLVKKIF